MSEHGDEDERDQEGEEEAKTTVPVVYQLAAEDKVGQIVKYLNSKEDEEFLEAIEERNPENGQSLMMWATLRQRFVLVEWLLKRGKREAFAFKNKQLLTIYDKWVEERKAKAERDKEAAEEAAARAAEGGEPPEEDEDKPAEPELHQVVFEAFEGEEGVTIHMVRTVGELGIYEGGRDEAGNKTGLGQTLFVNGDIYIGEYLNNKREGLGTYFWAKEANIYTGEWRRDVRWGLGRMVYADGGRYYGAWARDKKNGRGRYTYINGDTYDGDWEDDQREGQGTYTFAADSSSYVGTFRRGDFTSGKWVLSGGVTYYGIFKNFKPFGRGLYLFGDKFKQEGEYRRGEWVIHRVENLKSDVDVDYQLKLQGQTIALRYTPEQHGARPSLEQLVSVANCQAFQSWRKAVEAQKQTQISDIRIRSLELDPRTGSPASIRLEVSAYDATRPATVRAKLPLSDVLLQAPRCVVLAVLVHGGLPHVLAVRRPALTTPGLPAAPQLPTGRRAMSGDFRGAELEAMAEVFQLSFSSPNMMDLTELCFGNSKHSLLTSAKNSTAAFTMWLFKQRVHPDYFAALPARVKEFNDRGLGFELEVTELQAFLEAAIDTRTVSTVMLYEALGDRAPTQTVAEQRPPTPRPPEPEPAPVYTEAELAAQKAAFEAELARRKQKEAEARENPEEGQEE